MITVHRQVLPSELRDADGQSAPFKVGVAHELLIFLDVTVVGDGGKISLSVDGTPDIHEENPTRWVSLKSLDDIEEADMYVLALTEFGGKVRVSYKITGEVTFAVDAVMKERR